MYGSEKYRLVTSCDDSALLLAVTYNKIIYVLRAVFKIF